MLGVVKERGSWLAWVGFRTILIVLGRVGADSGA